jgi:phosphoribosylformylglycinamidine cyclo-ligase
MDLLKHYPIKGMAHITGGGLLENVPRILPSGLRARFQEGSWPIPPVFTLIQERGPVAKLEMYRTFNMGLGMVLVVSSERAEKIIAYLQDQGELAYLVGQVANSETGEAGVDLI